MRDEFPPLPGPGPAERPVRKPSRPYGLYPDPVPAPVQPAPPAPPQEARSGLGGMGVSSETAEAATGTEQQAAGKAEGLTGTKQEAEKAAGLTGTEQEAWSGEAATGTRENSNPLTPRQEAFCHHFVLLGNAAHAAAAAGYAPKSCKNQGYRLMRRPEIRARVGEVRRGLARAYALDADVLLGKLEALYERAVQDHHFHAAARAVELQARIAGHVKGRASVLGRADSAPPPRNDDR